MIFRECYRPWFIITGVVLIALAINLAWTNNTEPRINAVLREEGMVTSMAELRGMFHEPPEAENAALLYMEAIEKLQVLEKQNESEVERYMLPSYGGVTSWLFAREALEFAQYVENMRLFLEERQEILDLLYQAADREHCRWPDTVYSAYRQFEYRDITSQMYEFSRILYVERCLTALEGDEDRFLSNYEANHALGDALVDYPAFGAHLTRDNILYRNLMSLDIMFAMPELTLSDVQLQEIQEDIEVLKKINADLPIKTFMFEYVKFYELIFAAKAFYNTINQEDSMYGALALRRELQSSRVVLQLFYPLFGIKEFDRIAMASKALQYLPKYQEEEMIQLSEVGKESIIRRYFSKIHITTMMERTLRNRDVYIALTEAAIAVQRYFQVHDRYPESLEALVPHYLNAVPMDPFRSEQPVGYFVSDKGAILYVFSSERRQEEVASYRADGDLAALEDLLTDKKRMGTAFRFGQYLNDYHYNENAENHFQQAQESQAATL